MTMKSANQHATYHALRQTYLNMESERLSLEAQLSTLGGKIEDIRKLMAPLEPIHDLPDDVLAIIFEMAYQHRFPHCRRYTVLREKSDSEVVLTHVCKRWRRLAISLPSLWSCIHIGTRYLGIESASVRRSNTYIRRSGLQPLSVTISCFGSHRHTQTRDAQAMFRHSLWPQIEDCLELLAVDSPRWRNCAIFANNERTLDNIITILRPRPFVSLEFLQLYLHSDFDAVNLVTDTSIDVNLDTPYLKHCRSFCAPLPLSPASLTHLTELKLDMFHISPQTLCTFLENVAPRLQRLTLNELYMRFYHRRAGTPAYPVVSFPRLTFLAVRGGIDFGGGHVMNARDTLVGMLLYGSPALEALICIDQPDVMTVIRDSELVLLRVRSLVLWSCVPDERSRYAVPDPWASVLKTFPAVEHLDLADDEVTKCLDAVMDDDHDMDELSDSIAAWPYLRTVTMTVKSGAPDRDRILTFLDHCTHVDRAVPKITLKDTSSKGMSVAGLEKTFEEYHDITVLWEKKTALEKDPFRTWDAHVDRPAYLPWEGSMGWHDQF